MIDGSLQATWFKRFLSVLAKRFWLKCFGTPAFTFVFFLAYIHLLKHPYWPVTEMPVTWLDDLVSFQPFALLPYVSLWIYVSLPPMFMTKAREIIFYGVWSALLCSSALGIFYLWPSAVPAANIDWALYPGVDFLKGVDAAGNACPSLHVATSIFSAIWLHRLLSAFGTARLGLILSALWCAAIVYSTMATKQHVAVDVLGGAVLGVFFAWLSLRWCGFFSALSGFNVSTHGR